MCSTGTVHMCSVQHYNAVRMCILLFTVLNSTVHAVLHKCAHCTVPYSTTHCIVQYYTYVLYSTTLQYTCVFYCTVQYSTVQYSTHTLCTVLYHFATILKKSKFDFFSK